MAVRDDVSTVCSSAGIRVTGLGDTTSIFSCRKVATARSVVVNDTCRSRYRCGVSMRSGSARDAGRPTCLRAP